LGEGANEAGVAGRGKTWHLVALTNRSGEGTDWQEMHIKGEERKEGKKKCENSSKGGYNWRTMGGGNQKGGGLPREIKKTILVEELGRGRGGEQPSVFGKTRGQIVRNKKCFTAGPE